MKWQMNTKLNSQNISDVQKKAPSEETTETAAAKPAGDGMNGDNLIPLHCILCGYATAMRNS